MEQIRYIHFTLEVETAIIWMIGKKICRLQAFIQGGSTYCTAPGFGGFDRRSEHGKSAVPCVDPAVKNAEIAVGGS